MYSINFEVIKITIQQSLILILLFSYTLLVSYPMLLT